MGARVGERATVDFFAAQARARRRTAVLAVSFALAMAVVVAVVYLALLVVVGPSSAAAVELALAGGSPTSLQPALLLAAAGIVATVTGLGSAYHALRLSAGGGGAVAEMLGGTPVDRATQDPALRRLVNVAEEMAIASGLPVPRLYVLEGEAGINAFAAGYTPGHGVVAVTRGALDRLTRDEMQGVVAHELSHLLNGDTRIDMRLMAAVGGLTVLSLLGRVILRATPRTRSRRDRATGALPLVGLALLVAGAFGAFCGRLVRYAVARQREWLADASAVQFTRNPGGLAGALRKIAAEGSHLASPHAPEAAHLFFASGVSGLLDGLFDTHPPIAERIRRLEPQGAESLPPTAPPRAAAEPGAVLAHALATPAAAPRLEPHPSPEHVAHAAGLLGRLAPELAAAAREPFGARALACALLTDDATRGRQLEHIARGDRALAAEVERLGPAVAAVSRRDRLALLGLALPALDALSSAQARALAAELRALAAADGALTTFELAVCRVVLRRLSRGAGAPPRPRLRTLDDAGPESLELLSTLAWVGGRDAAAAQAALDEGTRALGAPGPWRLLPRERLGIGRLDETLTRLDEASPDLKGRILSACVACVVSDRLVTIEEAELVRAVSASLGLPLPPVVGAA
jgi:Zn-dependent protease with chaperone function